MMSKKQNHFTKFFAKNKSFESTDCETDLPSGATMEISICVVFDHTTVIFISKGKNPAGTSTLKQRWILVDHQRWKDVEF